MNLIKYADDSTISIHAPHARSDVIIKVVM